MVFRQLLPILIFVGNDAFHFAAEGQIEAGITSGHRTVAPDRSAEPHIFAKIFYLSLGETKILRSCHKNKWRFYREKLLGIEFDGIDLVVIGLDLVFRASAHVGEKVRETSIIDHALDATDGADCGIPA